ncbi:hypothetical protein AYP76_06945 [Ligilactobacillus agilis]|uniref:Uncharacterized protein n=1 Tax=Ligilactobacillus agilis TaxID=1601 RepID=A0A231PTA5_9LACO|nr:hypothetical protein [Ligilactobacillus agilis]MCI5761654.1 hypothetical protein [Ligilactobacillus agilis]MCL8204274.1 hypothetical protein [Ligilactobacillus agilis]OXC06959.1 hypothetical protein AYP74_09000 [Ligilactobacillus agilis]OXC07894.1 hypothetical protein AYP76_06945 [Ligilactobacillus agilis]OXC11951.1 hypothetical protein AYP75_00210 [Ligilactobacillus agilis]
MENTKQLETKIEAAERRLQKLKDKLDKQYAELGRLYLKHQEMTTGRSLELTEVIADLKDKLKQCEDDKTQAAFVEGEEIKEAEHSEV